MTETDAFMNGFLYLKAIVHRYDNKQAADLVTLGDRLVKEGMFPNRRAAIGAIEDQMGLPVTMPMSEEAATHATRMANRD